MTEGGREVGADACQAPAATWVGRPNYGQLTADALRPWKPGLYFEAYNWNGKMLNQMGSPLSLEWSGAGSKPMTAHPEFKMPVWYSNDNDFKRAIPGFNKNDKYIMRFRGMYKATHRGRYYFRTRSDDGSMLYLDKKLVVDNDGNHGMRTRTSSTILSRGLHSLNIVFYEVSFLFC